MVFRQVSAAMTLRATVALVARVTAELMVRAYAVFVRSVHYPAAASALQLG